MPGRFRVALSFPGEHREFVAEVALALAESLTPERVFYDEWYEVELLGSGGDLKLQAMYMDATLVVPFFSKHYSKPWCAMEWETIRGILLTRRNDDAVIPVHMDDADVPGWPKVSFGIRLRGRTATQIANLILQALAKRTGDNANASPPPPPRTRPEAAPSISPQATAIWREKLAFLQQQEAITADASAKFALAKQIEEARRKIRESGA